MVRRAFLKSLAALATPAFAPDALGRGKERIIVIGAGLSGLAAALELAEAGHPVTVVETQSRPGGRVLTLRQPFTDGLYAEAGAATFPNNSIHTLRYAGMLGIQMKPVPPPGLPRVYYLRGRRFTVNPGEPGEWPFELTAKEKSLGPDGILAGIIAKFNADPGPRTKANWLQTVGRRFDRMSITDMLRGSGASAEAAELLRWTTWYAASADTQSAMQAVLSGMMAGLPPQTGAFAIPGGNDALPNAMARRLGKGIRYNSTVKRIEQAKDKVRVTIRGNNSNRVIEADRVICTLPFTALRDVEVAPALSRVKAEAVQSLRYQSVTRIFLQMRRRYWAAAGNAGNASTDLAVMQVVEQPPHASTAIADSPGILEAYIQGAGSLSMKSYSPEERVRIALNDVELVHPGAHKHFVSASQRLWDDAYSLYAPNQFSLWYPDFIKPEGRLYFAGEHVSTLPGTMEGALESGVRAAKDILHQ